MFIHTVCEEVAGNCFLRFAYKRLILTNTLQFDVEVALVTLKTLQPECFKIVFIAAIITTHIVL
jgi:hypothetical protein